MNVVAAGLQGLDLRHIGLKCLLLLPCAQACSLSPLNSANDSDKQPRSWVCGEGSEPGKWLARAAGTAVTATLCDTLYDGDFMTLCII